MHMCWNWCNLLFSFWSLNKETIFKKTVYTLMQHEHPFLSSCSCCIFILFFSPELWLILRCKPSSKTLYKLTINVYDIQEPYLTPMLCKVYSVCLLWCFFSTLCQEVDTNRDSVRSCWYVLALLFFCFQRDKLTWQQWAKLAFWLYILFIWIWIKPGIL